MEGNFQLFFFTVLEKRKVHDFFGHNLIRFSVIKFTIYIYIQYRYSFITLKRVFNEE